MRDDVAASLAAHGMARERIAIERFGARGVDDCVVPVAEREGLLRGACDPRRTTYAFAVRRVHGRCVMDVRYALEDYEIARGSILLCQS